MTTPLDTYRHAWVDYWAHHLGPSYAQPPGNSYECDEFVAGRVFSAGAESVEPDRELRSKYDSRGMALAELERKLESAEEEIANLCVDKVSLTDRLMSATRRIAELEHWQKR